MAVTTINHFEMKLRAYSWEWIQLRLDGKPFKAWHYSNVQRAASTVAVRIGRAKTQGRPFLWAPKPGLLDHYKWRQFDNIPDKFKIR